MDRITTYHHPCKEQVTYKIEIHATDPDPEISRNLCVRIKCWLTHIPARPTRNVGQPDRLTNNNILAYFVTEEIHKNPDQKAPSSFNESLSTTYAKEWIKAIKMEMESLVEYKVLK